MPKNSNTTCGNTKKNEKKTSYILGESKTDRELKCTFANEWMILNNFSALTLNFEYIFPSAGKRGIKIQSLIDLLVLSISEDGHFSKKQKNEDDTLDLKPTHKSEIKDESDAINKSERSVDDLPETEMNQCPVNKSSSSGGMHLPLVKAKSPPLPLSQSGNQGVCNFNSSLSNSSLSKNYGTSCMGGLNGVNNDQSYYPHHSPVDRSNNSSFLPVTTSPNMLQPQSAVSSSLSLHSLSSMNQMQQCRLPGTTIANTDCALRQSSHLSSTSNYGLRASPTPQHPTLPSCTYMQTTQGSGYSPHLTPNVHMMNMNFPGPMA